MRRFAFTLLASALLFAAARADEPAPAWASVRSQNFLVVGDAGEARLREAASRLERFRDAFPRLFPPARVTPRLPTTVVVFRTKEGFRPFQPVVEGRTAEDVAGYFQSGDDRNYIALSAEGDVRRAFRTIYHEYVHLMIAANLPHDAPPWLGEGLSEFYSTFEAEGGDEARVGGPLGQHPQTLKGRPLIPLKSLFETDAEGLRRMAEADRNAFYAQSWALAQYLIVGEEEGTAGRLGEMLKFVELLARKVTAERAFAEAFGADYASLEERFARYVRRGKYRVRKLALGPAPALDPKTMRAGALTDAEVETHLGDLLLHTGRLDEAEARLRRAAALDPRRWEAHAALGVLLTRRVRFAEARESLGRAVELDAAGHLAHYYYAFALSREGNAPESEETRREMRAALERAIEIEPDFAESHTLLAWVDLLDGERLKEAEKRVERARTLAPGRDDHLILLAQIYLRQKRFDEAQAIVARLASAAAAHERVRERAAQLAESITRAREWAARSKAAEEQPPMTEAEALDLALRQALRQPEDGETRVRGLLAGVECVEGGIVFRVSAGGRALRLHVADGLSGIRVVTFVAESGRKIACGQRELSHHVVATFRALSGAPARSDGELIALEFVPAGFEIKP